MRIERRHHPRQQVVILTDIQVPNGPIYEGCARDISLGGVSVDLYGGEPPRLDARVRVEFIIWTGEENIYRTLNGRVLRSSESAVALAFEDDSERTAEIVAEILHYQQFERRKTPRSRPAEST